MHFYRAETLQGPLDQVTGLQITNRSLTHFVDASNWQSNFQDWVLNILPRLIRTDEYLTRRASGMRTFVRLDVGVYRDANSQEFKYYINQISKGINVGLYIESTKTHQNNPADQLFAELSHTLHFVAAQETLRRRRDSQ